MSFEVVSCEPQVAICLEAVKAAETKIRVWKDILLLVKHQLVHSGILQRPQFSAIFSQTKLRRWRRGFECSIGHCPRLPWTEFGDCSAAQNQKHQDTKFKMSKNKRVAFSQFRTCIKTHCSKLSGGDDIKKNWGLANLYKVASRQGTPRFLPGGM